MKFKITESKIENIVFKYLDGLDMNIRELTYKNTKMKKIRFEVDDVLPYIEFFLNDKRCFIKYEFIQEIKDFFSISYEDSIKYIVKWVEKTIDVSVEKIHVWSENDYNF